MRVTARTFLMLLPKMFPGFLAGAAAGMVFLGVGTRVAMGVVSVTGNVDWHGSFGSTFELILVGVVVGVIGGFLFQLDCETEYIPRLVGTKGATFGLMLFTVLMPLVPDSVSHKLAESPDLLSLAITVFGVASIAYGILLEAILKEFRQNRRICWLRVFVHRGEK